MPGKRVDIALFAINHEFMIKTAFCTLDVILEVF